MTAQCLLTLLGFYNHMQNQHAHTHKHRYLDYVVQMQRDIFKIPPEKYFESHMHQHTAGDSVFPLAHTHTQGNNQMNRLPMNRLLFNRVIAAYYRLDHHLLSIAHHTTVLYYVKCLYRSLNGNCFDRARTGGGNYMPVTLRLPICLPPARPSPPPPPPSRVCVCVCV